MDVGFSLRIRLGQLDPARLVVRGKLHDAAC